MVGTRAKSKEFEEVKALSLRQKQPNLKKKGKAEKYSDNIRKEVLRKEKK